VCVCVCVHKAPYMCVGRDTQVGEGVCSYTGILDMDKYV